MEKDVLGKLKELLRDYSEIEKIVLLFGHFNESSVNINNLTIMENLDQSSTSFSLDYEIMVKEIHFFEKKGHALIGIFHSHPSFSNTKPSKRDLLFMKNWPFPYVWVIGKNKDPSKIQIYTLYEKQLYEIPFATNFPDSLDG